MLNNEIRDQYTNLICGRCKHSDTPDAIGTRCYLCKRNPEDHRVDAYEPDYSKIYKSEMTGAEIVDALNSSPCLVSCNDYERRCCLIRCDDYDEWVRKLIK